MGFLDGITILLLYQLVGEITVRYLGLPIPGPVLGMILLFITLWVRKSTPEALSSTASQLLSHLTLLFVPAGVGMMVHFARISEEWLSISIALLVSTLVSLVATAGIMNLTMRLLTKQNTQAKGSKHGR